MTCEEARNNLPLFLYGELSFDEEEQVEVHVDECPACRIALAPVAAKASCPVVP